MTDAEAQDRLVAAVRRRLTQDPAGEALLAACAAEPTPENQSALKEHLVNAGLDQDEGILALLTATGPTAVGPGAVAANVIVQVVLSGTGFIGGTHPAGTVTEASRQATRQSKVVGRPRGDGNAMAELRERADAGNRYTQDRLAEPPDPNGNFDLWQFFWDPAGDQLWRLRLRNRGDSDALDVVVHTLTKGLLNIQSFGKIPMGGEVTIPPRPPRLAWKCDEGDTDALISWSSQRPERGRYRTRIGAPLIGGWAAPTA